MFWKDLELDANWRRNKFILQTTGADGAIARTFLISLHAHTNSASTVNHKRFICKRSPVTSAHRVFNYWKCWATAAAAPRKHHGQTTWPIPHQDKLHLSSKASGSNIAQGLTEQCTNQNLPETTRFRKVEGKLDRFSWGKLSAVYCVITWTPRPGTAPIYGEKNDMLPKTDFIELKCTLEKTKRRLV